MIILTWLMLAFRVFAQEPLEDWTIMSPLSDCPEFKVEYSQVTENSYHLRYVLSTDPLIYENHPGEIASIKDLSKLNDLFKLKAINYCPNYLVELQDNQCKQPLEVYSTDYLNFMDEVIAHISIKGNCDEVAEFRKLQDDVLAFKEKDILDGHRTHKFPQMFFKLFADKESDQMIDTFYSCGGKRNSSEFIKNLILVEARNACIMPSPPGYLSWGEASIIAKEIGDGYSNTGLLSINKHKDDIEKESYLKFTEAVVKKQIQGPMPEMTEEDLDTFLESLDTYTNFQSVTKNTKGKLLVDGKLQEESEQRSNYLTYVFSLEAPFEIMEKLLPKLISDNFMAKLPSNWSAEQKQDYMDKTLIPLATTEFAKCAKPYKEKMGIQDGYTQASEYDKKTNSVVNGRKEKEKAYCAKNPASCVEGNCTKKVNYLTDTPEVSDTQKVQSCVYGGIISTLPKLFDTLIMSKADELKGEVKFTLEMTKAVVHRSWGEMAQCMSEETYKINRKKVFPVMGMDAKINYSAIETLGSDQLTGLLFRCSDQAEDSAGYEFVEAILFNNSALKSFYPKTPEEKSNGPILDDGPSAAHMLVAGQIIRDAYTPCLNQQYKIIRNEVPNYTLPSKDPTLCTPLIEIKAAQIIIAETIKNELKLKKLDTNPEAKKFLSEFNSCSQSAYQKGFTSIGNSQSATPITTTQEANTYLDNDNSFFNCTNTLITATTGLIAGVEFDLMLKDPESGLSNPGEYAKNRPGVVDTTKKCFQTEIGNFGTWPNFKNYMSTNSFDGIKNKCTLEATKFMLPVMIVKETKKRLDPLKGPTEKILKEGQAANIIALSAADMRREFGVNMPDSTPVNQRVDYSIKEAYGNFEAQFALQPKDYCKDGKKPTVALDEFLCYYEERTTLHTMEMLHSNLKEKAVTYPASISTDFFKHFTPGCMKALYHDEEIAKLPPGDPGVSTFDSLVTKLKDGFRYLNDMGEPTISNTWDDLDELCKAAPSFDDLTELRKFSGLDFVLKAQIKKQVIASLEKTISDNEAAENLQYANDPYKKIYQSFIDMKKLDSQLAITNYLYDAKKFDALVFNDDSVIGYLKNNFIAAQTENSPESKELSAKIMTKIFDDQSPKSFASAFVEAQVVGGIGMGGYLDARKETIQGADDAIWDIFPRTQMTAVNESIKRLNELWNYTYIEGVLDFSDVKEAQRKKVITSIFDNMILPAAKGTAQSPDKVTKVVNDHMSTYDYPGYPKGDNGHTSAKAKIAEDISKTLGLSDVFEWRDVMPTPMPFYFSPL